MSKRFTLKSAGMNVFAPTVTEDMKTQLRSSELWVATLKICNRYPKLRVTEVKFPSASAPAGNTYAVRFGLTNLLPVMKLIKLAEEVRINTYDRPDGMSNSRTSTAGKSGRIAYLLNRLSRDCALSRDIDAAIRRAEDLLPEVVRQMGYAFHGEIRAKHIVDRNVKGMLSDHAVSQLLRVFGGEINKSDMEGDVFNACTKAFNQLGSSNDNTKVISARLKEMFDRERWLVGYVLDAGLEGGYYVTAYNTSGVYKFYDNQNMGLSKDLNVLPNRETAPVMPLTFYQTFEDIPEDIRNSITPQLVMANLSFKSAYSDDVRYDDPKKYLFAKDWIDHDLNTISYSVGGYTTTWMSLEK